MNPNEPRRVWLLSKDGVPFRLKWALVKTAAEVPSGGNVGWHSALSATELEADGYDATPTQWRRCPPGMEESILQNADVPLSVEGRVVTTGGLSYDVDRGGRAHPAHKDSDVREPLEPDAVIADEDQLLAMAEKLGHDFNVVEHATGKKIRCVGRSAKGALDASTDEELLAGNADVVISRKADNTKRKVEQPA